MAETVVVIFVEEDFFDGFCNLLKKPFANKNTQRKYLRKYIGELKMKKQTSIEDKFQTLKNALSEQ